MQYELIEAEIKMQLLCSGQGDVLVIDNRQVMHARRSFTPPRQILACLQQEQY